MVITQADSSPGVYLYRTVQENGVTVGTLMYHCYTQCSGPSKYKSCKENVFNYVTRTLVYPLYGDGYTYNGYGYYTGRFLTWCVSRTGQENGVTVGTLMYHCYTQCSGPSKYKSCKENCLIM